MRSGSGGVSQTLICDESEGFAESDTSRLLPADPSSLKVIAGDFDGDTRDELVIAVVEDASGSAKLYVLTGNTQGGYAASGPSLTYSATQPVSTLEIEVAAGLFDRDRGP